MQTIATHENAGQILEVAVVKAEGARIMIASCHECGAAILLDPRDEKSQYNEHQRWHREQRSGGNK